MHPRSTRGFHVRAVSGSEVFVRRGKKTARRREVRVRDCGPQRAGGRARERGNYKSQSITKAKNHCGRMPLLTRHRKGICPRESATRKRWRQCGISDWAASLRGADGRWGNACWHCSLTDLTGDYRQRPVDSVCVYSHYCTFHRCWRDCTKP